MPSASLCLTCPAAHPQPPHSSRRARCCRRSGENASSRRAKSGSSIRISLGVAASRTPGRAALGVGGGQHAPLPTHQRQSWRHQKDASVPCTCPGSSNAGLLDSKHSCQSEQHPPNMCTCWDNFRSSSNSHAESGKPASPARRSTLRHGCPGVTPTYAPCKQAGQTITASSSRCVKQSYCRSSATRHLFRMPS